VKARRKEPLERQRPIWVNNIKMDLENIEQVGVYLIGLANNSNKWSALVNVVMKVFAQSYDWKFFSIYTTGGLSSSAPLSRVSCMRFAAKNH
jgi:hypothetical protein